MEKSARNAIFKGFFQNSLYSNNKSSDFKTTTKALIGFHNPYFWILRHLSSANKHLSTFESKQTLRQQIKKQTFPKATFQRILRILLGNEVYHTEDAYRIAKGGALSVVQVCPLIIRLFLQSSMSVKHCQWWTAQQEY